VISEKRHERSPKPFRLYIGNDPALWRYASLQEALATNCDAVAKLILEGERHQQNQANFSVTEEKEVEFASSD
jgi:hypothetical protein